MALKFSLSITIDNDAMRTGSDIGEALTRLAAKLFTVHYSTPPAPDRGTIRDLQGKTVGLYEIAEDAQ